MTKKALATLGLAAGLTLSGIPKAQAENTLGTKETKEDLIEAITREPENYTNTISFEDAKNMQNQHQLFTEFMDDEDFQKLIDEYGQENVEKVMNEILQNKDIKRTIRKVLEDEKAQEALKNGNNKEIEKIIKQYINSEKTTIIYGSLAIISALLLIIYKKTQ